MSGNVTEAKIVILKRSFSEEGLAKMQARLDRARQEILEKEARVKIEIKVNESYRNMKYILDKHPAVVQNAEEAVRRIGLTPVRMAIRGGTDGARLSFEGLPTPNLSAGGYNFHSPQEWIPVIGLVKAVEVLKALMAVYVEKGI